MISSSSAPVVSVVIPAHNAGLHLSETLESVLRQTWTSLEVVVVDDGSTDDTPEIVRRYAAGDLRVRLIQQSQGGVAAARNAAIGASRGRYIAPLDADDFWAPEKLQLQVERLESAPARVALVSCWWADTNESGQFTGGCTMPRQEGRVLSELLLGNFLGNSSTPLIRRSALETVGLYDTSLYLMGAQGCEDRDLYMRLAEQFEFAMVARVLVAYRRHLSAMSFDPDTMDRSNRIVMERFVDRHQWLGRKLLRWSRARYVFYLMKMSLRADRPWTAMGYFLRLPLLKPQYLSTGHFYRQARKVSRHCLSSLLRACFPAANRLRRGPDLSPAWGEMTFQDLNDWCDHRKGNPSRLHRLHKRESHYAYYLISRQFGTAESGEG